MLNKSGQFRLFFVYGFILAVLFACSWLLYSNFQEVNDQQFWVVHTNRVLNELEQTFSAAKDGESADRALILTGQDEYLTMYHRGMEESFQHAQRLRELVSDNTEQRRSADEIIERLKHRFDLAEQMVKPFLESRARPTKQQLKSSQDEAKFLREQIDKMKAMEMDLLVSRQQTSDRSRYIFDWILVLVTALMATVISIAFFQIHVGQRKTLAEAKAKADEAYEKDLISGMGRVLAGDMTFEEASSGVLNFLSDRLGFLAGQLWINENGLLNLAAARGVNESMTASRTGLVEMAFDREQIWRVPQIPENYWKISSGLGESLPQELVFVPFAFQGKSLGVIELASFQAVNESVLQLLTKMADTIAVGLNAAVSRSQLQVLLERTQQQSEELQAQQEELKTNNEELEQQARALESQQQTLNAKNRELEVAGAELEAKALDLQRSSQYKSDFLAKMSHELRTPLNGLLILSTLLVENKEKNLTEHQMQFAKSINSAGNDLLVLINDILDLSKIEARKLSLRPERFGLRELVASKRRTFEPQAQTKGLAFKTVVSSEAENVELYTDRQRLEQVLRNFLSNAIKFTDTGSVSLEADYDAEKKAVRFAVVDTGIGVPKSKQASVFEAFEQGDSSVSRKYGGTGLGLTISRELASLLGGEIYLESEEGIGSRFTLMIPINLPQMGEARAVQSSPSAQAIPTTATAAKSKSSTLDNGARVQAQVKKALQGLPLDQKTILIVEDDLKFRSSVVEAAKAYGFHTVEVSDGEVALAILNEYVPDAILLDIKLPGISGLGILEMIKKMPNLRHIPVHMISAMEYQNNALRMGALGYLTKPVTIEKVRSALGRIENLISKKVRRVLLIEDDERQNQAIAELIAGNDLEVVSARTGKAAVAELKKDGFDCIILDLTLPDVSGFDLLSELRALEISLPPVVIYTGRDLSDEEEQYLRKYSDSIVIKGARSPERLLDEVNLFLHRVESLLPEEKQEMLSHLRSQEKAFEGRTILVVDDDIRNVFALNSALETRGLQVRVARDGVEALEALESHRDIDLVLMDIMMPRMDGFEAMRRIRGFQDGRLKNIPIVALTAKAMREDHEKCIESGANDYLPKPVNLDNLTTVLKVWLAPKGFIA